MPVRLASPRSEMKPQYDVVVVGSGYGGSIAASRLARAGKRVCLLERGREFQPGDYPDTPLEATSQLQLDDALGHQGSDSGLFDLRLNKDICVLLGCGLGGTSLINANVSIRAEPRVFEDPKWPQALRADVVGLQAGYLRAEQMLKPARYPESTFPKLAKLQALRDSAAAMGAKFELPTINVNFEKFPDDLNHVGVEQKPCSLCGDCVSGCNHGAKNTVLMNYLPDAKNFGAEIFTECSVKHLERIAPNGRSSAKWRVHFQVIDSGREKFDAPELFVEADVVVLAAGSLGSTEILLRSKSAGLPLSTMLGKRFTGNGDVLGFAYNGDTAVHGIGFGHREPTLEAKDRDVVGPCITGVIDLRNQPKLDDGMIIEDGSIPGALGTFLPAIFSLAGKVVGKDTGSGASHFIDQHLREAESLIGGAHAGAMQNTQTYLVMTHDDGEGQMSLQNDRLRIAWPNVGGEGIFQRVNNNLLRATKPGDGTFVKNPISDKLAGQDLITVHPLGGCVMGEDAARGVVDHKCRVFAGTTGADVHDGLYVCDGSVIPRPLGVNPLLTISAVSERAVALLADDRHWAIDYQLPSRPKGPPPPAQKLAIEFTERMVGPFSTKVKGPPNAFNPAEYQPSADQGALDGTSFEFELTVTNSDLEALIQNNATPSPFVGTAISAALSAKPLTAKGTFILLMPDPDRVEARRMAYEMLLSSEEGKTFHFYGYKIVRNDDFGLDAWPQTSTLYSTVRENDKNGALVGRGILGILPADFAKQITTMNVMNAPNPIARFEALVRFGRSFAGTLWDVYGGYLKPLHALEPNPTPRKKRPLRAPTPEVYRFKTADGVVLQMERYPGTKGPVLLSHGLGVSGRIFALDTIDTNLVEYLSAHGYDVWNLENRASIDLPSSQTQFNMDDVAGYDYPAAVKKILEVTDKKSVQVVAHCFGATTFTMSLLAGAVPGVRSAVCSQVSAHIDVPLSTAIKSGLHVPDLLAKLGVTSLSAYAGQNPKWSDALFDDALRIDPVPAAERCTNPVCHRISFLYGLLYDHANLNELTHQTLQETFGVANIRAFEQLALLARTHHVVKADGSELYMHYPDRMKIPIAFIQGADNQCFKPSSTQKTFDWLSDTNGGLYSRHLIPGYGHIDCIMGKNASRDVFPFILNHLDATQDEQATAARVARVKKSVAAPAAIEKEPTPTIRIPDVNVPPPRAPVPTPYVRLYQIAAISNFIVTLPAFFAWDWYVGQFHTATPNYPFTFWIWSGMAFLWGVMFWEISRDMDRKFSMIKYSWLEKMITTTSVAVAYFSGNVPASFIIGVVYTDLIWIPMFMFVHWKMATREQPAANTNPAVAF